MSESFDPYRVWLGIPPEARPPTHYQLLGISPDEREQAVIEAAVLRQSGYVRNFQIGKYAKDAARILNEIAAAKACLLDPVKRAEYAEGVKTAQSPPAHPHHYLAQRAAPTLTASEIDLGQFAAPVEAATTDLIASSAQLLTPAMRTGAKRAFKLSPPGGGASSSHSRITWQSMAGFAIGFAFALLAVALWPKRSVETPLERESPVVLSGTLHAEPPTSTPNAESDTPAGQQAVSGPKIVQVKTLGVGWPGDVARREGDSFFVGIGGDYGSSAVGYELQGARRVRLSLRITGMLRRIGENSLAGFVVDYRTQAGYSQRVALPIGPFNEKSGWVWPRWGKNSQADRFVDISEAFAFNEEKYLEENPDVANDVSPRRAWVDGQEHWQRAGRYEGRYAVFGQAEIHELNLEDWAPPGWDGNAWISAVIVDTGARTGIEGRLIEPAPPDVEEKLSGEYRRLTGHTDSVTSLAFLPDGRLLSGSFDTTWAIWEIRTGIETRRWSVNEAAAPARTVAVAPNGQSAIVAVGSDLYQIGLPVGNHLKWLNGHTFSVMSIAYSPDSRRAVSGGYDGSVRCWDLESGSLLWDRSLGACWHYSVDFAHDGGFVVVGRCCGHRPVDNLIGLLDINGNQIKSINVHDCTIIGLSLSPDNKRCLVGSLDPPVVKLWDVEMDTEIATFDAARGGGSRPVFSPDGRYAAWGGSDQFVSLWDIEKREIVAEFEHAPLGSPKHRRRPHDWTPVAFSPDGKLLASGADDGTIYVWNVPATDESEVTDDAPQNAEPTQRGQFTPLDLSRVATIVTTQGMFHSQSSDERIVFDDWSPKTFEGVPFELVDPQGDHVRNAIMLYGPNGTVPPTMPLSVKLACGAPARAIHFLSGVSGWGAPREIKGGSVSMIVRLRYADGVTEEHPLRNGEHFADYVSQFDVPKSKLAFLLRGKQLRYFAIHPKRREPIERLELTKGPDYTAPIVVAITIEGL